MSELRKVRRTRPSAALLAAQALCLLAGAASAFALLIGLQRLNAGVLEGPGLFGLGAAALVVGLARAFPAQGRTAGPGRLFGGGVALSAAAGLMLVGGLGAFH
jgi:hypothetical protein